METVEPVALAIDTVGLVRDSFNVYVQQADSLLKLIPQPMKKEKQDFMLLMKSLGAYNTAWNVKTAHPGIPVKDVGLEHRMDSLNRLRKELFETEIDAAKKFADVGLMEPAQTRYENAEILAVEENQKLLETVGKKIKK